MEPQIESLRDLGDGGDIVGPIGRPVFGRLRETDRGGLHVMLEPQGQTFELFRQIRSRQPAVIPR